MLQDKIVNTERAAGEDAEIADPGTEVPRLEPGIGFCKEDVGDDPGIRESTLVDPMHSDALSGALLIGSALVMIVSLLFVLVQAVQ